MQYLLLLYAEESKNPSPGSDDFNTMMAEFEALGEELESKGVMRGGNGLQDVDTATTVRMHSGDPQITDGPFADT